MDYITTNNLRTQSSKLIDILKKSGTISLVHRSKIVGVIKPIVSTAGPIDINDLRKFLSKVKLKKLVPRSQREKVYRKTLVEKYGKGIS